MIDFINIDRRKFRLWWTTKKTQARLWTKRSAWKLAFLVVLLYLAKQQKVPLAISDWQLFTRTETTKLSAGQTVLKNAF